MCRIGIAVGIVLSAGAASARGNTVAKYHDDFQYPTPKSGWSYLWNRNGAIGTAANYVPLVADFSAIQRYETENQTPDAFPDAAPGSSASATSTTLIPGQGSGQNALERYVIAAYTISAADIAANGNQLILQTYSFAVADSLVSDGISAKIYKNDTLLIDQPLPPGLVFTSDTPAPNGGPIPFGPFAAGDKLYVAIGSNGVAPLGGGTDTEDVLTVDYTIALVPEPAAAATLVLGGAIALLRRRSRRGILLG